MTSLRESPAALAGIVSLAEGSTAEDAVVLAPDAKGWFASPEQGLVADIEAAAGAEAVSAVLARLAPSNMTVVAVADADDACWAEVTRSANGDTETCLVRLSYDAAGRVCRVVWLRAPFAPASAVSSSSSARSAPGRSWTKAHSPAANAARAMRVTPVVLRIAPPIRSQSAIPGFL